MGSRCDMTSWYCTIMTVPRKLVPSHATLSFYSCFAVFSCLFCPFNISCLFSLKLPIIVSSSHQPSDQHLLYRMMSYSKVKINIIPLCIFQNWKMTHSITIRLKSLWFYEWNTRWHGLPLRHQLFSSPLVVLKSGQFIWCSRLPLSMRV